MTKTTRFSPPRGLDCDGRRAWRRYVGILAERGDVTPFLGALEQLVRAETLQRAADADLQRNGFSRQDGTRNPAAATSMKTAGTIARLLAELGLTPQSARLLERRRAPEPGSGDRGGEPPLPMVWVRDRDGHPYQITELERALCANPLRTERKLTDDRTTHSES